MKIKKINLPGLAEIFTEPHLDDRGYFVRVFCQKELSAINKNKTIKQINFSYSRIAGTVRGLHFQFPPKAEDKIVICLAGKICDVIVDIRKNSKTFGQHHKVVLDAEKMNMLYIPKGFAHGFQTLMSNCRIQYLHTEYHSSSHEGGFYFDSPSLNIKWPLQAQNVSPRDKDLPEFDLQSSGVEL